MLRKLRLKYPWNPLIGYLNKNYFRNNITDVRDIIGRLQLDFFVINETKLDSSLPSAQLHKEDYEIRKRKDRDERRG